MLLQFYEETASSVACNYISDALFPSPMIFFIHEQRINLTIQTSSVMAANRCSALGAASFFTFLVQKFFHHSVAFQLHNRFNVT